MPDFIQMYTIGRLGNQMLQYAFLKKYAETNGLTLQVPERCGLREVFEIPELPLINNAPMIKQGKFEFGIKNVMVKEYFQDKRYTDCYDRDYCRQIFKPKFPIAKSKNVVAHQRMGDYRRHKNIFCLISPKSFHRAFEKYGYDPLNVFWVREGDNRPFIEDFASMVGAEALFRANSTFSLWAHVLADDTQKCYSPIITGVGDMDCEFTDNGAEPIVAGGDRFDFAK